MLDRLYASQSLTAKCVWQPVCKSGPRRRCSWAPGKTVWVFLFVFCFYVHVRIGIMSVRLCISRFKNTLPVGPLFPPKWRDPDLFFPQRHSVPNAQGLGSIVGKRKQPIK